MGKAAFMSNPGRFATAVTVVVTLVGCSQAEGSPTLGDAETSPEAHSLVVQTRSVFDALPKGATFDFEQLPTELRPVISSDEPTAFVSLPIHANDFARVADPSSGLSIGFRLVSASSDAIAEPAHGFVVYRGVAPRTAAFHRPSAQGVEDFVRLEEAPHDNELRYELDVSQVQGLRKIGDVLELLDAGGAPRLRVTAPYLLDAGGIKHPLSMELRGCAADTDPRGPWGRLPVEPGNTVCELAIGWEDEVEYPVLVDPAWNLTGVMAMPRTRHSAGVLPSGKVLVAGGSGTSAYTSEVWDPATGTWAMTGNMIAGRADASDGLILLPNDLMLLVGTHNLTAAELYSEASGTWSATGLMKRSRSTTNAIELDSRQVLIAGGFPSWADRSAEVYDNQTNAWTATGDMTDNRYGQGMVKLLDGRVLAAGGWRLQEGQPTATAEIYDPATNQWQAVASMSETRARVAAALLPSGEVVVAGGATVGFPSALTLVEKYNPTSNTWTTLPSMSSARYDFTTHTLSDGRLIAIGGFTVSGNTASTELWSQADGWVETGSLKVGRDNHTSTMIGTDRILAAGGGNITNTAEIFAFVQNGGTCARNNECVSNLCVEGVCCNSACTGTCQSCRASKNGGTEGTCAPIPTATDPDSECGACQACSGAGACGPVAAGTDPKNNCKDTGSPTCDDDGLCDGNGACQKYAVNTGCQPRPCTSGSQCQSGYCTDGICCDSGCWNECMACTSAKKGTGVDGQCGPIAADSDPDEECDEGPNYPKSCLADGMCDGQGVCRIFAKDTVSCGATQCNGNASVGLLCNGAGTCGQAFSYCDPYRCQTEGCLASCTSSNDCVADAYCTAQSTCANKLALGSACASGAECLSNYCVDSVCCDSACSGQCEACNVEPNVGSCSASTGAPVGTRPACVTDDSDCAGSCDGVSRAACSYPGSQVACGTPTCTSGIARSSKCNGQGACVAGDDKSCGAYACGATDCNTSCTTAEDCSVGYGCTPNGICVPGGALPNGFECTQGDECTSGFCADGVCCDSACSGQCEACNVEPNVGACSPVNGQPAGTRPVCISENADCAGSCDGVNRGACSYPGAEISCGTQSCTQGVAHASSCNAKGACIEADDNPCGAYACGESKCKTTCATVADCAPGYSCGDLGICVPGGSCSEDLTRTTGASGERSCAPFLCDPSTGTCRVLCSGSAECAPGYVCDTTPKTCVPAATQGGAPEASDGCGCRIVGTTGQAPRAALWLLAGLAAIAARRRSLRTHHLTVRSSP